MSLAAFANGRTVALSGILLFFLLGSFGISLAHDPANLEPLRIVQLSQTVSLSRAQPERFTVGPALLAEPAGAQWSLDVGAGRVEYCSTDPGGRPETPEMAALRTPKVSLQITKSALQI
ncbi:MAG TPA: hypothetical protein VIB79_17330 [Candidatus Binatia bacterium]|jgi:hypothetical protein